MCVSTILEYTITIIYKKICAFSGLRPLRLCVSCNISRASSRIFRATPIRACLMAGRKATNNKKSAVGGKKSPAAPIQKKYYLIIYRWHHINGITQAVVFLPPTADFLNGQRPLFDPCRLLSSCKAWRWGMVATTRRKTRFLTGVTANLKKAKPTTAAMAFCVYINLLQKEQIMD